MMIYSSALRRTVFSDGVVIINNGLQGYAIIFVF